MLNSHKMSSIPAFLCPALGGGLRMCDRATTTVTIPGTPCFTPHISASPMRAPNRRAYLDAAGSTLSRRLSEGPAGVLVVTLLVPELNPSMDIYDRRFLLSLVWTLASEMVLNLKLRTRVLIQGTGSFGAIPLSISGLRKHFDGDREKSKVDWENYGVALDENLRSGDLERVGDLDENDDAVIVVSPTNAVAMPVVNDVQDLLERARSRPVVIVNPRLSDVPSHSGVMQVSGRSDRIALLNSFEHIFMLRLLFRSGSVRCTNGYRPSIRALNTV